MSQYPSGGSFPIDPRLLGLSAPNIFPPNQPVYQAIVSTGTALGGIPTNPAPANPPAPHQAPPAAPGPARRRRRNGTYQARPINPAAFNAAMARDATRFPAAHPAGLGATDQAHWTRLRGILLDPSLQAPNQHRTAVSTVQTRAQCRCTLRKLEEVAAGTRPSFRISGTRQHRSVTRTQPPPPRR